MTDRWAARAEFLAAAGWGAADIAPLAGDASARVYSRLRHANNRAILMDAPPATNGSSQPFVDIARHLSALGLSAPQVLDLDLSQGFLLLEDLGDGVFANEITRDAALEIPLYEAAVDLLVTLHRHPPPPGLQSCDPATMSAMTSPAFDHYAAFYGLHDAQGAARFQATFETLLQRNASQNDVLILRDYHSENAIWLPDRLGVARVGLLDFQDAMTGHKAYDLMSFLQDIRREVSPEIEAQMIKRYIAMTDVSDVEFRAAYAVLGAQRNIRILGVFTRLCMDMGKPRYVDFLPRVYNLIQRNLTHSALDPVRDMVLAAFPEPTPRILEKMRSSCPQPPTP